MITNIEKTILEKFRKLSLEQQKDVLEFLDLIEKNTSEKDINLERKQAKAILQRAKERSQSNISKSVDELWTDFNQVKDQISSEFENQKT
ncbi:conserved hypothetical protein [Rippkaea orientalis PCC 8801]|uniref:DUF2281 domain-containing protein n=1 Tax=Rippkaea orientalis (strain PCC 8801 / RF-1) TaxID=41431 RepID=B7JXQ6_RIPO1|nr:hypothetical protein [Rippkaea orientalis]ACK64813.1 conserved hypothetical protein [Rippkaea orientalis PCC 8801]